MKRRMSRAFLAFALVSPFAVTPASAQVENLIDFWAQCTPGLLRACSSTQIWNEVVGGETYLMARISNLQGTRGFNGLRPAGLVGWEVDNLQLETYGPPATFGEHLLDGQLGELSGNARACFYVATDCVTEWDGVGDNPDVFRNDDGTWRLNLAIVTGGGEQTVWGCDIPDLSGIRITISTCGGDITWRIQPARPFGLTTFVLRPTSATSIEYHYRPLVDAQGQIHQSNVSCRTGVDCVTVTPEPATIFLMASGLLGIVVVARRRKRS